jgi:hypothetical protein
MLSVLFMLFWRIFKLQQITPITDWQALSGKVWLTAPLKRYQIHNIVGVMYKPISEIPLTTIIDRRQDKTHCIPK